MEYLKTFYKSILAGLFIAIGGTIYLSLDNKIIGALFFSVGLLGICATNQMLLTGRCCYTLNLLELSTIFCGNTLGAMWGGFMIIVVRPNLVEKTNSLYTTKIAEGWHVVILGFLCNILIYLAVEGYKSGHVALLIIAVATFILCGFEHSIANIFYFTISDEGLSSSTGLLYLCANVFGNLLGGFFIQFMNYLIKMKEVSKDR